MREKDQTYPIRRWKLANFKSVEKADVELAPLSVLVGPNSSGKSSLIQSMLLIAQAAKEGTSPWLPLNGSLVELGDVQDVVFAGKASGEAGEPGKKVPREFLFGADFDLDASSRYRLTHPGVAGNDRSNVIHWEAGFGATKGKQDLGVASLRSASLSLEIDGEDENWTYKTLGGRTKELDVFSGGRYSTGFGEILKLRGSLSERPRSRYRRSATRRADLAAGQPKTTKTAGLVQVGGIPIQYFVEVDRTTVEAREILERLVRVSFRYHESAKRGESDQIDSKARKRIETGLAHLIITAMEADNSPARRRSPARPTAEQAAFLNDLGPTQANRIVSTVVKLVGKKDKVLAPTDRGPGLSFGLERIGNSLAGFMSRSVRYLGPLREDPRVVYLPTPGEREGNVGKKGEKAIALLHTYGNDIIDGFFSEGQPNRRCTLAEGVNYWLHFFGIAEGIGTELRPRLGLEPHLDLKDVGRPLDMTAVGVGVSQIFPVLVMGLHSKPGSVLLMEQPELHLHPALQQRLGDFLLACARSGRQLIVETHSDHLISRLRRRVAEDDSNQLQKSLAIIFAERNEGRTTYRPVEVNRFGGIEEWPCGFFDQAAKESQLILRAGLDKKKRESSEQS